MIIKSNKIDISSNTRRSKIGNLLGTVTTSFFNYELIQIPILEIFNILKDSIFKL